MRLAAHGHGESPAPDVLDARALQLGEQARVAARERARRVAAGLAPRVVRARPEEQAVVGGHPVVLAEVLEGDDRVVARNQAARRLLAQRLGRRHVGDDGHRAGAQLGQVEAEVGVARDGQGVADDGARVGLDLEARGGAPVERAPADDGRVLVQAGAHPLGGGGHSEAVLERMHVPGALVDEAAHVGVGGDAPPALLPRLEQAHPAVAEAPVGRLDLGGVAHLARPLAAAVVAPAHGAPHPVLGGAAVDAALGLLGYLEQAAGALEADGLLGAARGAREVGADVAAVAARGAPADSVGLEDDGVDAPLGERQREADAGQAASDDAHGRPIAAPQRRAARRLDRRGRVPGGRVALPRPGPRPAREAHDTLPCPSQRHPATPAAQRARGHARPGRARPRPGGTPPRGGRPRGGPRARHPLPGL